jgi:hypothetical protein
MNHLLGLGLARRFSIASAQSSRPYRYEPLNTDTREIRLLHLGTSTNTTDPLTGQLTHVSLTEKPFYNALSYMWGDPSLKDSILINGRPLAITYNQGQALRHIRRYSPPNGQFFIWIDGVCIDQRSIRERNHQVSLMHTIYKGAELVITRLDISFNRDDPLFRRMLTAPADPKTQKTWMKVEDYDTGAWNNIVAIVENEY